MKFKTGDQLIITAGKDRGRKGLIKKLIPGENKAIVEGINKYKKHLKPQGQGKPGGITELERPINLANVALLCPACKQPTRIGYLLPKTGPKLRICRKCKKEL